MKEQGTTAYDQWEGNNGTLGGGTPDYYPTWKSGGDCVSGKCLEFDGNGDYIKVINNTSLNIEYVTVEAWTYSTVAKYQGILSETIHSLGSYVYMVLLNNTQNIGFYFTGENGGDSLTDTHNVPLNKWNHITVTYDGTTAKIYLNGEFKKGKISTVGKLTSTDQPLFLGTYWSLSGTFTGLIDEVRIYNSAVTITQIQSQYLAGLDKLLSNGAISKSEYNQRIKKLSKEIVIE